MGLRSRNVGARAAVAIVLLAAASAVTGDVPGAGASGTRQAQTFEEDEDDFAGANYEVTDYAQDAGISTAEAEERLSWQAALPGLVDDAEARLGDAYGGIWVDRNDGDRIKLAVARQGNAFHRNTAAATIAEHGLTSAVDIVSVTYSEPELLNALDELAVTVTETHAVSPLPLSVSQRPDRNAVVLHLPPEAANGVPPEMAAVVDQAEALGDMVQVAYDAAPAQARLCQYPYCDPPLRSGIRINGNLGGICTGGFLARSRSDNRLYQFTAGHCHVGGGGGDWSTRFRFGTTPHRIGVVHNRRWDGAGDMAILRVENPSGWRARAWVYVTSSDDTTYNASYDIANDGRRQFGQRICTSGGRLGHSDCGHVTGLGVTERYCMGGTICRTVNGLGRASFCGVAGDSGAPVYASHVAYGLQVSGYSRCDSLYQGIRAAEDEMNVNVSHEHS